MSPALSLAPFVASASFLLVCVVTVRATLALARAGRAEGPTPAGKGSAA